MPDSNAQHLTFKLVYYGPAQSGKTTNLLRLHDLLSPQMKGEMMSMETKDDRTLFFDLLPLGFRTASELLIKFRLFTVPGQVADADRSQETHNRESFQSLADNCARVGLDFEHLPLVVQFNKCDLPNAVPEAEIRQRWAATPWPLMFSVALTGQGIAPTFEALLRAVYRRFAKDYALQSQHGLAEDAFVSEAVGQS